MNEQSFTSSDISDFSYQISAELEALRNQTPEVSMINKYNEFDEEIFHFFLFSKDNFPPEFCQ